MSLLRASAFLLAGLIFLPAAFASALATETNTSSVEFLFVDRTVPDADVLLSGLVRPMRVVWLDPTRDPFTQIATELEAASEPVAGLHILSHGAPGALYLGNNWVNEYAWRSRSSATRRIAGALAADAVVLLYACQVGADPLGQKFVNLIRESLKATVFASTMDVGASAQAGDWSFAPESLLAFTAEARDAYHHLLSADRRLP